MRLTVLNVAYPLAPVGQDSSGGAEQVLAWLDAALVQAGHRSLVLACEGSRTRGILWKLSACNTGPLTVERRSRAQAQTRSALRQIVNRFSVDVVHMHGVDCINYLPEEEIPTLITLHLPPEFYSPDIFHLDRPATYLNCVSHTEHRRCPQNARLLPPIDNGVPTKLLRGQYVKRHFVLALGRICPEKGFHLALMAAKRAGAALLLGGRLFRYAEHERYFRAEISPRLDSLRRYMGPLGFRRKRRLLRAARCLLIPSLVPETSSLVAMEALACATPVIAFRSGALSEIIEDGKTGFLVDSVTAMADAISAADQLDPETCRETARRRFNVTRMTAEYLSLYERLAKCSERKLRTVNRAQ